MVDKNTTRLFKGLFSAVFCAAIALCGLPTHAGVDAQVGLESQAFLYQKNGFGESIFPSVGTRVSAAAEGKTFSFGGNAFARVFISKGTPYYFDAPEAWMGTSPGVLGDVQLSFGRKKVEWSRLDEVFNLGIWAPRFRWDPINPESVALMGFLGNYRSGMLKVDVFASPLFLPEAGVPMNFSNGAITSPSPFGMATVSNVAILGTNTPVIYDLQIPSIAKLVFNPSFSARIQFGSVKPAPAFSTNSEGSTSPAVTQEGVWTSVGYAYKPINQILMQLNYKVQINSSVPYVLLPLQPRVAYHHLATFESGYESENVSLWASALGEMPIRDATNEGWMTQEVGNSIAVAANVEWRMGRAYIDSPRLRLSALQQWGGNLNDSNPPPMGMMGGSSTGSYFEQRYPYQTAVQAQFWSPLPIVPRLFVNSRVLMDIGHDGIITSNGLIYRPGNHWMVGMSADFLVTGVTRYTGDLPGDFIGKFHDNSRIQAGLNYVF